MRATLPAPALRYGGPMGTMRLGRIRGTVRRRMAA
jgi:hypothetical protein